MTIKPNHSNQALRRAAATMINWLPGLMLLLVLALLILPGPAEARHYRDWARDYARTAVDQAELARRYDCGYGGPRWSLRYEDHYYWARRQSPSKASLETGVRRGLLQDCRAWDGRGRHGRGKRGRGGYVDAAVQYAEIATRQAQRNLSQRCGYHGPRWSTRYLDHLDWARGTASYRMRDEIETRDRDLARCRRY